MDTEPGKMMKDIILINGYRVGRPVLPTGIGYIAQAIENAGFVYDVCDVNLQTDEQIVHFVKECQPKYVGCGSMTHEVEKNYELLLAIRQSAPNVIIVLGGPHVIAAEKDIFQECPSIDLIVKGEGEEAIVRLLQGVPLHSIPRILTRDSQTVINYDPLDIDTIAFPKYTKFDIEKFGNTMNIASSRGCVYKCSFCGAPKFLGKKWRAFKLEAMIEEFEYWYGRGYRHFYFSDSLFALDKKRVIGFCTYIVESGYREVVFTADGLRADHLTLEILQHMKKANFTSITLGVESVNDETLIFLNKGQTFSQIDKTISMANSLSFDIQIYLIIGSPHEKYEDAIKSINYAMQYANISGAIFSKLMPIKGTSYYDYAIMHELVQDKCIHYPKQEAYGTNERFNSHNAVELIWETLLPLIDKTSRFLTLRSQIKKSLAYLGCYNVDVMKLNFMTQICLNPVLYAFISASVRLARSIRFK